MEVYYTELASMIPGTLSDEQIGAIYSLTHGLQRYHRQWHGHHDTYNYRYAHLPGAAGGRKMGLYLHPHFPWFTSALFTCAWPSPFCPLQQLSDSGKVPLSLPASLLPGTAEKQINRTLLKQMSWFYLCPILPAVLISGMAVIIISRKFVNATGVSGSAFTYFGTSFLIFVGIYLLYFIAAYVGFVRDVWKE